MKLSNPNINQAGNRGVTLIELLVVVSILSVLTAIMIPRLRVINKDRNIREAARVVGSTLAKVNNRAIDEGVAGFIIERNNNFEDTAGVFFAGTRLYAMRGLPPYAGDDVSSLATIMSFNNQQMVVNIARPIEHTNTRPLIQVYDQIRLNYSSVRYRIINVSPGAGGTLDLTLSLGLKPGFGAVRPTLPVDAKVAYVIYRQPRKLESSRVDLPDGYVIDLRYSGPFGTGGSVFNQVTSLDDTVQLFFNSDGAIDRYAYTDGSAMRQSDVPKDTFYFLVSAYEPDSNIAPLFSPSAMWVTIDRSTGSVNVAYNAPPPSGLANTGEEIQFARGISVARRSANQ